MSATASRALACQLGHLIGAEDGAATRVAGPADWLSLASFAGQRFLLPALLPALERQQRTTELPGDVRDLLSAATFLNAERNALMLAQLEAVTRLLNGIGIEPLLLKGACHLVLGTWPDPGQRVSGDLDILVPEGRLADATAALDQGVPGIGRLDVDPLVTPGHKHIPPHVAPDWVCRVELHFAIMVSGYRDLLPAGDVRRDSRAVRLGQQTVRVPSPTHQVAIALLHGFVADRRYYRPAYPLRELLDIACLMDRDASGGDRIDWPALEDHLYRAGWGALALIANQAMADVTGRRLGFVRDGSFGQRLDRKRWVMQRRLRLLYDLGTIASHIDRMVRAWLADDGARPHLRAKLTDLRSYPRYLATLTK